MQMLELPGYTVSEFERLARLPKNMAYKLIRRGELTATVDVVGQYRIPYGEAAFFVWKREQKAGLQA